MSRARRIGRRVGARAPAARIVVVMEGASTEPRYLKMFRRIHGHQSVTLAPIGGVGDPRAVVERAIEESRKLKRDALADRDSVWAMFDRDIHPRFAEAKNLAHGNGISLAVSNPCFELWGILHYQDQDAPLDRHECQRLLGDLCPGYRKSGGKVFDDRTAIDKGYLDAVKRAGKSLERRAEEDRPGGNPSTSVHLVTEQIRLGVDRVKRKK